MSKNNIKDDPRTIYKIHANNTFVSVIGPDINSKYDNVVLEFVEFDKQTKKKVNEIDVYYDIPSFLTLCQMIIDKSVINTIKFDKQNCTTKGIKYSSSRFFQRRGGGDKVVGKDANGTLIKACKYRELYFCASSLSSMNGMVTAEECDGTRDDKGLINPKTDPNTKKRINSVPIRVPFLFDDLFNMAMIGKARIEAFILAKQIRGDYNREPVQEVASDVSQAIATDNMNDVNEVNSTSSSASAYNESYPEPEFDADQAYYEQYMAQYS